MSEQIKVTEEEDNAMTSLVFNAISAMLGSLSGVARFTNCAVMSAAIHVVVDSGMRAVEAGAISRDELADQVCAAVRAAIKNFTADEQRITLQ